MRIALAGITMGLAMAVSLRREGQLSAQAVTLSIFVEMMTIISLGLIHLS